MIALLLAAATVFPVEQAERAFASMAQTRGQWTAFRAFAAPDAVMFIPGRVRAQDWLAGRKDPPASVMWWPARIAISCDGSLAASTGSWVVGQARGYFTTIWQRQPDGAWKWIVDSGDALDAPRPVTEKPVVIRARCTRARDRFVPPIVDGEGSAGLSHDGTLAWSWTIEGGTRRLRVNVAGIRDAVITDEIKPS